MRNTTEPSLTDLRDVLVETWAVNDAMNQLLLDTSIHVPGARNCPAPAATAAAPSAPCSPTCTTVA